MFAQRHHLFEKWPQLTNSSGSALFRRKDKAEREIRLVWGDSLVLRLICERRLAHCFTSTEVACESSLFRGLRRAKPLKPLSTATLIRLRVCVCVRLSIHQCGFKMLVLFIFILWIYLCRLFCQQLSQSFLLSSYCVYIALIVTVMYTERGCRCVSMCAGSYSLSSSTVELLFDEMVIPSLIESRCSLSPFNGLPVIILSFFQASTSQSLWFLTLKHRVNFTHEIVVVMGLPRWRWCLKVKEPIIYYVVKVNENEQLSVHLVVSCNVKCKCVLSFSGLTF